MTTYDEIMQEIKQEITNGQSLDEIKDRSYELVDNYVPVYNNRILEEWAAMPSDYDNRGAAEYGYEGDTDIIRLMILDLSLYYGELVSTVLNDLEEELESAE
jgi:hypothetical protein